MKIKNAMQRFKAGKDWALKFRRTPLFYFRCRADGKMLDDAEKKAVALFFSMKDNSSKPQSKFKRGDDVNYFELIQYLENHASNFSNDPNYNDALLALKDVVYISNTMARYTRFLPAQIKSFCEDAIFDHGETTLFGLISWGAFLTISSLLVSATFRFYKPESPIGYFFDFSAAVIGSVVGIILAYARKVISIICYGAFAKKFQYAFQNSLARADEIIGQFQETDEKKLLSIITDEIDKKYNK